MLTNTHGGQLPDLELRHRRHARVEDRIRNAKDTGMRNLPFHNLAHNRVWLAITAAGNTWGLGRTWANRRIVEKNPWLR